MFCIGTTKNLRSSCLKCRDPSPAERDQNDIATGHAHAQALRSLLAEHRVLLSALSVGV